MIPNKNINPQFNKADDLVSSRAYTFLDSYIYMRNGKYNALYNANKEILAIEREALDKQSAEILYYALTEQTKMLNTVVIRIRNFAQNIRGDVIQNLQTIIPEADEMRKFEEALKASNPYPQKVVNYKISPIEYPNMAVFYSLFKRELKAYADIEDDKAPKDNPFIHTYATKFLIDSAEELAHINVDILSSEEFFITNLPKLIKIKEYFKKKQQIITGINRDFRTFYFYLRQFRMLQKVMATMNPTVMNDGRISVAGCSKPLNSFSDYLIYYKHYTMMVKYLIDVVSTYDMKFFNKIYAIQSNIEVYRAVINSVVSRYQTQMRNNESAEIDSMISGVDNVNLFLNDAYELTPEEMAHKEKWMQMDYGPKENWSAEMKAESDAYWARHPEYFEKFNDGQFDIIPDTIHKLEVPKSLVADPEDAYEYDPDEDLEEIETDDHNYEMQKVKEGNSLYTTEAYTSFDEVDKTWFESKKVFDSTSIKDLISDKQATITEAVDAKVNAKKAIQLMRDAIIAASAKFKDSAKTIREEYAETMDALESFNIDEFDLTGIEFETFKYHKGVDHMHHIKIPTYRPDDNDLLTEGDGIGYKQKYFKDLYYFSYKGQPLNKNRFRGSQAKSVISGDKIKEAYEFFTNFIDTYNNTVVRAMAASNTRIANALRVDENMLESAFGRNDLLTEAILINRSMFKNDLYSILLEAGEDDHDAMMDDLEDIVGVEPEDYDKHDPEGDVPPEEEIPEDEENSQEPKEPEREDDASNLNIDEPEAEKANKSLIVAEALRMYCKICYEVQSARMDIYEEIYETAFKFLHVLITSTKK